MKVKVLFFGATADIAGLRETHLDIPSNTAVASASELVLAAYPDLRQHKLLLALNEEYAAPDRIVADGDELAIFTPVSGG
jgi:molybdopterin converting factor subunit 1